MRRLWQKHLPWWRWLPLMLPDSTEQIKIKLSLSLSLSVRCSLTLPSYSAALQSPSHLMLRGRTAVRDLSLCTVNVNIRNMLPLTLYPSGQSVALQSLTNPHDFLFTSTRGCSSIRASIPYIAPSIIYLYICFYFLWVVLEALSLASDRNFLFLFSQIKNKLLEFRGWPSGCLEY